MTKLQLIPIQHCTWEVGGIFLKREIIDWLVENDIAYNFYMTNTDEGLSDVENLKANPLYFVIQFYNDADAVMFKMRW
jgi:hypothetical protein